MLNGYDNCINFIKLLIERKYKNPRIVDLNIIFNAIVGVLEIYKRILFKAEWKGDFYFKVKLLNVWRTMPFIDVTSTIDSFAEFGLPICFDRTVVSPLGSDPDTFLKAPKFSNLENERDGDAVTLAMQALDIFSVIAKAWGITMNWTEQDNLLDFATLNNVGLVAVKVQALRNAARDRRKRVDQ